VRIRSASILDVSNTRCLRSVDGAKFYRIPLPQVPCPCGCYRIAECVLLPKINIYCRLNIRHSHLYRANFCPVRHPLPTHDRF
jgi:hypothetical protein